MDFITLENQTLQLKFNRATGALATVRALECDWDILDRPELGLSFRLLVPTRSSEDWHGDGRRNNPVLGEKQPLTSVTVAPDRRAATFVWDGVTSEHAGPLAIKVTVEVVLSDRQAAWTVSIDNRSAYIVETVQCPYFGDLRHPPQAKSFKIFSGGYCEPSQQSLWPTFTNTRGYYGNDRPINPLPPAPVLPFTMVRSEEEGVYFGLGSNEVELVSFCAELTPGYDSAINSHVPTVDQIAGVPVATQFSAVQTPHIMPGEARRLVPIVVEPFRGDWHVGADVYRRWRESWMKPAQAPAWAAGPHSWLQIHINSPEDELRMRFTDLPAVGEECARHGVSAIQLVGWNDGGQDQGNPSHDPDPRLGTFDELKEAIARVQALGVRMILFSKFTWADRGTKQYRETYFPMAIKDPYGDEYVYGGYQYQTMSQFLNINPKRLVPMCFLNEAYMKVCDREFAKLVDLGAAGTLFDESQHHSPAFLCFDMSHGHRYGAPVYSKDRELVRRLLKQAPKDFLFAGEACYDWEFDAYQLSYFRTWEPKHLPLWRYLLPQAQIMTAITGFNDRNMINQCLLYRYVMSYEPYNFKGRLDDFPATMAYGKKMDALRTELRDWFWDGEFRDTVGGAATVDGQPHHPFTIFAAKGGAAGMAVANYDLEKAVLVKVSLANGRKLTRYRLVDEDKWRPLTDGVTLPPASAAVVLA